MARRAAAKLELLPISAVRDWAKYLAHADEVSSVEFAGEDEAELWWTAMEGLVAGWSASAAFLGEKDAVDRLFRLLDIGQLDDRRVNDLVASALAALAKDDPKLRRRLGPALARHGSVPVRAVAAGFLSPGDESERGLLRELAGSSVDWLAKKARESLERAGALDWWAGRFAADPAALVRPEEAEALTTGWRRYAELFDLEEPDEAQQDEIVRLVGAMHPKVAAAAVRVLVPAGRLGEERLARALVAGLREPESAAIPLQALELAPSHLRYRIEKALEVAAAALPLEIRRAAARRALSRFETASKEQLEERDASGIGAAMVVCGALWPAEDDPTLLFELHQRWGEADIHPRHETDLRAALTRAAGSAPGLRALFSDWLRDPEAPRFRLLSWRMTGFTDGWPAGELLSFARSCLGRPAHEWVLQWVVKTFAALDPDTLVARWNDPLLRPAIFGIGLDGARFVRARRELREGRLDLHEAAQVAHQVAEIWGGLAGELGLRLTFAEPRRRLLDADEVEDEDDDENEDDDEAGDAAPDEEEKEAVDEHAPEKQAITEAGGADVSGPLTDDEWRILRALRDAVPDEKLLTWSSMRLMPVGPWHPADRAFLDRCVAAVLERRERKYADMLLFVMVAKPLPEFAPLLAKFDDLLASEDDRYVFERVARIWARLYPTGKAAPTASAGATTAPGPVADDEEDW